MDNANLIPLEQRLEQPCRCCQTTKSVKYELSLRSVTLRNNNKRKRLPFANPLRMRLCNRCVLLCDHMDVITPDKIAALLSRKNRRLKLTMQLGEIACCFSDYKGNNQDDFIYFLPESLQDMSLFEYTSTYSISQCAKHIFDYLWNLASDPLEENQQKAKQYCAYLMTIFNGIVTTSEELQNV